MKIRPSGAEVAVGAFVLLAFFGFLIIVVGRGGSEWFRKRTFTAHATFREVSGVRAGTVVKMNGIEIGVVEAVSLDEHARALIRMTIKDEYRSRIRQSDAAGRIALGAKDPDEDQISKLRDAGNSLVRIEGSPLGMGDAYISVSPASGGPDLREAAEEETLVGVPTRSVIIEAFEELKSLVGDLGGKNTGKLPGGSVGAILQDDGKLAADLQALITKLNTLFEKAPASTVGQLLSDDAKAYHRLLDTIDGLKAAVEKLQSSVSAASADFGKSLDGVNSSVDASAKKLAGTLDKVNDTLAGMDAILADIRERGLVSILDAPGQVEAGQVKRVLEELEKAIKGLREATSKLPGVLDDGGNLVKGGQDSLRKIDSLSIAARRHWLLKGLFGPPDDGWLRATDPGPEAK